MTYVSESDNYSLEAANLADGRIVYDAEHRELFTEYHHKDHLGNVRLAFADRNADGKVELLGSASEITQQNDFYPFGMAHAAEGLLHGDVGGNRWRYNGKELNTDLGLYDYGARWYDPATARWGQVDPLADKFSSYSAYNYVLNNPTNAIDPDGRDVILLIDNDAPFGTGLSGHGAVLIGNDQTGWTFYSKTGDNNPNGTAVYDKATFSSLQDFQDQYGRTGSIEYGYRVKTTEQQDATMLQTAEADASTLYEFAGNNCSDFCRNVIESGGVDMGEPQTRFGATYPFAEYREFAATGQGMNLIFAPEGSTPEMFEGAVKKGSVAKEKTRKANTILFSQLLDSNGQIKVEAGSYMFNEDGKLVKQ